MTDLQRIKISILLFSAQFWIVAFFLYFSSKNLSSDEIYLFITIYYFLTIILEFPTGVIGDYFSHKVSVILGYFFLAVGIFSFIFIQNFWQTILASFVYALGSTLVSGSDTSLLYSLSKDFKKDSSQLKIYSTLIFSGSLSLGGWISSYDLSYPFYVQSVFFIVAMIFIFPIKSYKHEMDDGNIFSTAKEGLKNVFLDKYLLNLTILSSLILGFFFNLKWFYNPLFIELKIDVKFWGILGGMALLFILLGSFLYKKFSKVNINFLFFGLVLSIFFMGFTYSLVLAIFGLFLVHVMRGFFGVKFNVDTNKIVKPTVRASVLSFQSLLTRLISMIIVFASGIILERFSFFVLMCFVLSLLMIFGMYSVLKINKFEKIF